MQVRVAEPQSREELKTENDRLRELLHAKVAEIRFHRDNNDRLLVDAARWNFAKRQYAVQLGYDTPDALQTKVDRDMGRDLFEPRAQWAQSRRKDAE